MKRLTYANVMSTIACFLALSTGGAYAKATFIDGRNIKANSIRGAAIQNGTLTKADLAPATVTAFSEPPTPNGNAYGTTNPPVQGGGFSTAVVPTGAGQPCIVIAGSSTTYGSWEQTSGGLYTCNNGDGQEHGPVPKGILNGGANAF